MKIITSPQNPLIKQTLLLQEKSRLRKESGLIVIDGWKETLLAIKNGFQIKTVFYFEQYLSELESDELQQLTITMHTTFVSTSEEVFDKLAFRGRTSKIVSIAKHRTSTFENITENENGLYLVLDGIEKPGNLGAILRIADAAGVNAVVCSDVQTDIFNPNVIRSSVGCVFSQKIICAEKEQILDYFQTKKIQVFTTSLKAAKDYLDVDYTAASAFVFGTEAEGVQSFWEENANQNILITMRGQNDSLNVSNSVAIVIFEALRQRQTR